MRPCGEARTKLVASLQADGCGGLADLVARTGLDYAKTRQVLGDCVRAGAVTYTLERRPHARRPVAVYRPAAALDEMAESGSWHDLLTAWRG